MRAAVLTKGTVSALGVMERIFVKGDDDGLWYSVGFGLDTVLGVYVWTSDGALESDTHGTRNISDEILGPALYVRDPTNVWHQFNLLPSEDYSAFVWTDVAQSAATPNVFRRVPRVRAEDGIYLVDIDGNQVHKMGITGGLWSELTQGYSIPL